MHGIPVPPLWFLVPCAFIIGACIGSFLNVVIARVPHGQSVVWPPSHCMSCGKGIKPFHNIPILSWFLLRGRCSNCRAPFSIRYALIELAFALVCAFAVARHGFALPALHEIVLMGFLIPLAATDLDCWLLPRELTWPGVAVGLLLALPLGRETLLLHLFAAALGYTSLVLFGKVAELIMKKEAIGGGDPPLYALIGAFLGLKALLPVLLFSSFQSVLIGGTLLLLKRRREAQAALVAPPVSEKASGKKAASKSPSEEEEEEWVPDPTAIPWGPFLALAAAEVQYFPQLTRLFELPSGLW